MNPCYINSCYHHFEEHCIRLALDINRRCPLCKKEATKESLI